VGSGGGGGVTFKSFRGWKGGTSKSKWVTGKEKMSSKQKSAADFIIRKKEEGGVGYNQTWIGGQFQKKKNFKVKEE